MSINTRTRKAMLRATFPAALLMLPLIVATGCEEVAPESAPRPVPKVTVAPVLQEQTQDFDEYTGRTEAFEAVEVRSRLFGFLRSIEFQDGDYVQEGQTLFTIEPDEYEAIHGQSVAKIGLWESKLELAKATLARSQKLLPSGAISREEYEEDVAAAREAEAALGAAKADANRTAVDLKYTEIKAPISGRIDRAMVAKGTLLTGGLASGTLLTKIVNEQPMYVYFDVDERSLLRYLRDRAESRDTAPGSLRTLKIPCSVQLADETDYPHQGELDFAESEVNASTGTARLRGVFANKNRELVSGLFVRIRVPASKSYTALLIPERALATDQDIKFVYVVGADGIATRRDVELGSQRGELRIITSGLKAGERVISKGLQRVRPGQKVEVEEAAAQAPPAPVDANQKPAPPAQPPVQAPAPPAQAPAPAVQPPAQPVPSAPQKQ